MRRPRDGARHATLIHISRRVCRLRGGADVRPDFNWNSGMSECAVSHAAARQGDLMVPTWLLDKGHVVAKRLGHDAAVLLKVYAKRTQRGDEKAAETTGELKKGLKIV